MKIKTGLKAGASTDTAGERGAAGESLITSPFINKWMTCYRCKGIKDQYGNVSNATCKMCWPMGSQAPV